MVSRAERKAARSANSNPVADAMVEGQIVHGLGGEVMAVTPPVGAPALLSRVVLPDEHDEDPNEDPASEAPQLEGSGVREAIALDERKAIAQAARKAALLEAAAYAEGNWGSPHVAQGLREKAAKL
jgi:hypothetical protein